MEIITVPIKAGETKTLHEAGEYFELIDAVDPIDVVLYHPKSSAQSSALQALSGVYMRVPYDTVNIKSATAQTLRILVAEKEGGSRRQSGNMNVVNTPTVMVGNTPHVIVDNRNSAFTHTPLMVSGSAGGDWVLNANPNRRYLQIENKSSTVNIYVGYSGATDPTTGSKIKPGEKEKFDSWVPSGNVYIFAETATTSPVLVIEG